MTTAAAQACVTALERGCEASARLFNWTLIASIACAVIIHLAYRLYTTTNRCCNGIGHEHGNAPDSAGAELRTDARDEQCTNGDDDDDGHNVNTAGLHGDMDAVD